MGNVKKIQIVIVMCLCFVVLLFTMAFFFHTSSIQQTIKKNKKGFNIKLDDLSVVMVGDSSYKRPYVNKDSLNNIWVKLVNPGDKVVFRFNIINDGDESCLINRIKQSIHCNEDSKKNHEEICNNLKYSLEYENGEDVLVGNTIFDNSTKNIRLSIEYPKEISDLAGDSIIVKGEVVKFYCKKDNLS